MSEFFKKNKNIILEIIRFLLVGGLATLVDWGVSFLVKAIMPLIMVNSWDVSGTISTACGFIVGLFINYFLSIVFVYKDKKDENEGYRIDAFPMYDVEFLHDENGDIVLVKEQESIEIGQIGIFTIDNSKGYIKKLGDDRLISLNSDYDDILFKDCIDSNRTSTIITLCLVVGETKLA